MARIPRSPQRRAPEALRDTLRSALVVQRRDAVKRGDPDRLRRVALALKCFDIATDYYRK